MYKAKKDNEQQQSNNAKPGNYDIYRFVRQMRKSNQDVVGEKCVKNDSGELSTSDDDKKLAWKEHYERLLNVEFPWDPSHLDHQEPISGPPLFVSIDMVSKAVSKMKPGKAAGPSGIVAERLKAAGEPCLQLLADLANTNILETVFLRAGRKVLL